MGWRYTMITLGGVAIALAFIRLFIFRMPESPRYLLSKGRDAEAVDVVNYIARYNGKPETLTLDMLMVLNEIKNDSCIKSQDATTSPNDAGATSLSYKIIIRDSFRDFSAHSYRKLFAGRKIAQHSSVSFLIWLTIGIAYPLYFAFITSYLETKATYSANDSLNYTYKVYCIVSVVGVLGPIAAGFSVETRLGRRWMMALSSVLTGIFLFAYTAIGTQAADIGFQCATAILGNFEYAIMFAFTPESFPGPVRGTGTGIAATLLRIGGLVASFISTYAGYSVVPIYASAALWVVAGFFCIGLPFETHGHASI
ncbi:hypothetical protein N0V82_002351 [Gnomoniopsis sp. IMI 355080]|nr:hypothetical protein N0V82_002351 [Gnomoniopsis sp. IMI 355080]